jgi:hypothetical protein
MRNAMKKMNLFIALSLIISMAGSAWATGETFTTYYHITKPPKGAAIWNTTINANMDTIDSALNGVAVNAAALVAAEAAARESMDNYLYQEILLKYGDLVARLGDLPEVYVVSGTFNGPTGEVISLPKTVDAINEYAVAVEPITRAGAIGDVYVTQGHDNATIFCSSANTTDGFNAIVIYREDTNPYGTAIHRKWYVSPLDAITDHCNAATEGSLAWVVAQIAGYYADVELPGNHEYAVDSNCTIPQTINLIRQEGARFAIGTGHSLTVNNTTGPVSQWITHTPTSGRLILGPKVSPVFAEWFVTDVTPGTTNMGTGIQGAIDSAWPGAEVELISDNYTVMASQIVPLEGGNATCSLVARNGMHLVSHRNSTIRMGDNQSTDDGPLAFNVICSNSQLSNVVIDGITFDLNGQHNKISPDRLDGNFTRYNTAALIVSGDNATLSDSKFMRNTIKNTPGVSCVVLGQDNHAGQMSKNVEIGHNTFYNNGIDTDDHSSVYAWCNGCNVHDNIFWMDTMSPGGVVVNGYTGPLVATELHGSRNHFVNNTVYNYTQGLWIAGNYSEVAKDFLVSINHIKASYMGIGVYVEDNTTIEAGLSDALIIGNEIVIDDDNVPAAAVALNVPARGISIEPGYGAKNFSVIGNQIRALGSWGSIGIAVNQLYSGGTLQDIVIQGNPIRDTSIGISVGGSGLGTIGPVFVKNNTTTNMARSTIYNIPQHIIVQSSATGTMGTISLTDNIIYDSNATNTDYGIVLSGTIGTLIETNNQSSGLLFGRVDNSVVTNKYGRVDNNSAYTYIYTPTLAVFGNVEATPPLQAINYNSGTGDVPGFLQAHRTGKGGRIYNAVNFENDNSTVVKEYNGCVTYYDVINNTDGNETVNFEVWCKVNGVLTKKVAW